MHTKKKITTTTKEEGKHYNKALTDGLTNSSKEN